MSTTRTIYKIVVHEILDHTPTVRELILRPQEPSEFVFRAGQFIMLHVPVPGAKPALRAYSIASDERSTREFRLLFKEVKGGVASTFVWALKKNEVLDFTGPFGRVFFLEPPPEQIIFLCTGTGLAPHMSYLLSKKEQYPNLRYHLYFGLQKESDIYYVDELKKLAKALPHFRYHIVLSRPEETWLGKRGYVQHQLVELEYQTTPTAFYLCGNNNMIREAKEILAGSGVDSARIFSEAFD